MNKTKKALQWLADHPDKKPIDAAREVKIAPATVYKALKAQQRPRCPTCGHLLSSGSGRTSRP